MTAVAQLFDLTGRVVVITGGSAGLGLQMASGFAEAGARVVVCSRNPERCEEAARGLREIGGEAAGISCDVSKADEVSALADEVIARFGRVDVLVNNAGRTWWASPEDTPLDKWQYVVDLNVTGTFLCAQAFGRHMIRQKSGRIINIASVSGLQGKNPEINDSIAYTTTKGAVVNMTRDLAVKWAKHNILVNAIAPGFFLASRNRGRFDERRDKILGEIPLGRPGGDNDLKGVAVFLASDAANFITGAILPVDGGVTAW
jgi:NAD(P)-dependent dehydrogenase (short-subunit alcohol dehydrogenase family)